MMTAQNFRRAANSNLAADQKDAVNCAYMLALGDALHPIDISRLGVRDHAILICTRDVQAVEDKLAKPGELFFKEPNGIHCRYRLEQHLALSQVRIVYLPKI